MAPPNLGLVTVKELSHCVSVNPEIATSTVAVPFKSKIRALLLPEIDNRFAPGPSIVIAPVIASSPWVSVIVWPLRLGAKVTSTMLAKSGEYVEIGAE